jgi:hypothetical protein
VGREFFIHAIQTRKRDKLRMRGSNPDKFADRQKDAAKARQQQLEKVRAKMAEVAAKKPLLDAERAKIAAERAKREEERRIEKEARAKREAEEREAARIAAEAAAKAEAEAKEREKVERLKAHAQLLADQKAARDARYAARKKRQK